MVVRFLGNQTGFLGIAAIIFFENLKEVHRSSRNRGREPLKDVYRKR